MEEAPLPAGWNALTGRVVREKFVGKVVQFDVGVGNGTVLVVDGTLAQARGTGATVQLSWEAVNTHIYPFAGDAELGISNKKAAA